MSAVSPYIAALALLMAQPSAPPAKPVTESLYGRQVTDPYRYFEAQDASVVGWIKAQGAYTRTIFDSLPGHAALVAKLASFEDQFNSIKGYQRFGGREFFLEQGASNYDLMVRDSGGTRKLIDTAALSKANHGTPFAISYYQASPDGTRVAAGLSRSGSEDASIFVYDVGSGRVVAGPVDRSQISIPSWNDTGTVLYFNRLRKLPPDAAATDKYKCSTVQAWDLKAPPVDVIGRTSGAHLKMQPAESPQIVTAPSVAALVGTNGAQPELAIWLAPQQEITSRAPVWKQVVRHSDGITAFALSGDTLFLLSNRDAPTFKVLTVKMGESLASARTLLPARSDRIIASLHAAADGLYIEERAGLYSHLLRIARGMSAATEIPLPGRGAVSDVFTDPGSNGITYSFESWTIPPREYHFDPSEGSTRDLALTTQPTPQSIEARDLQAKAKDGTRVPLTAIGPDHRHGPRVTLLRAYGSYGISYLPSFNPIMTQFVHDGSVYAICHVRGGGELGDAWRLGGKDTNKPNTWRDLIACAEDLVARGIARKDGLFIYGGSAGGITVGMATVERPDLFAGVIDVVPPANMVRLEFMPDGPLETQEFGSINTEQGFRNLLAIDTYQNVRKEAHYPPVLITMGMNDARIAPWQPAKLAAKLIAYGNPTLLRVDLDNGHGVGETKQQHDLLFADIFSFIYWHSGRQGWTIPEPGTRRASP
jgi:prolyl oligopeptidase